MSAPLYGLVLAGGRSRRMGRDKAALTLDGEPVLARAVRLLEAHCDAVYVSVRPGDDDALRARFDCIEDRFGSVGPADGIASAQAGQPHAAWLVVACDLPLLDDATLVALVGARDSAADATAFTSRFDALPEPLCAIWEPASAQHVRRALDDGLRCARKILLGMNATLLPPAPNQALDNANTPEDWARIRGARA